MKKIPVKIGAALLISLLAISAGQLFGTAAKSILTDSDAAFIETPLSNEQIKATWSNLPTAKTIYENDICVTIDLRYCGKQVSSMNEDLPDPESPTVIDMKPVIVNKTSAVPNLMSGGLKYDSPQIWLQYDENIWVKVPSKYLSTSTTNSIEIDPPQTWSAGIYCDPQEIAGSYDVWGAMHIWRVEH